MRQAFHDVLIELLGSKKFLVFIATVVVMGGSKILGILHVTAQLTTDDVMPYLVLVSGYLVGQGVADHNKEAAKITAAAMLPPRSLGGEGLKLGPLP